MPETPNSRAQWAQVILEQIRANVTAIKELGERAHQINNIVNTIPFQIEIKLNKIIADFKDEIWEEINREDDKIREDISELKKDIAVLQVKAGIWGAIGAILGVLSIWLAQKLL